MVGAVQVAKPSVDRARAVSAPIIAKPAQWFLLAILLLFITAGTLIRFQDPAKKKIWVDETVTLITISSDNFATTKQHLYRKALRPTEVSSLLTRQDPTVSIELIGANMRLMQRDHGPIYFVLAKVWASLFGNTISSARLLTTIIGVLAIPCAFFAAAELFNSRLTGWIAAAITSVCPFYYLCGLEARPQTLWVALMLLSYGFIARACKYNNAKDWWFYALTSSACVLTYPVNQLVVLTQIAMYCLLKRRGCWSTSLLVLAPSLLALFAWWCYLGHTSLEYVNAWYGGPAALSWLVKSDCKNLVRIFVDYASLPPLLILPCFLLICASIKSIWKNAPALSKFFILSAAVYPSVLFLCDLTMGGFRSSIMRYQCPLIIAVQFATAFFVAANIRSASPLRKRMAFLILITLLSAGISSQIALAFTETVWTKEDRNCSEHAAILNRFHHPLWLTTDDCLDLLHSAYLKQQGYLEIVDGSKPVIVVPRDVDAIGAFCSAKTVDLKPTLTKLGFHPSSASSRVFVR